MTEPSYQAAQLEDGQLEDGQLEDAPLEPAPRTLQEAATVKEAPRQKVVGRRCRVTLEDPATGALDTFEVRVDNRDYLRWDKTAPRQGWVRGGKDAPPVPPFLLGTFLAWSASTRAGRTQLTYPLFEQVAVEVENLEDVETDPTQ